MNEDELKSILQESEEFATTGTHTDIEKMGEKFYELIVSGFMGKDNDSITE